MNCFNCKKNNLLVLVSTMVVLFTSSKEEEKVVANINTQIIALTSVYDEGEKELKLSEIASNISYIQLETNEKSIIGPIQNIGQNVSFYKDKILVKDKLDNLLLFNTDGDFLSKIGSVGRGANEYQRIDGFTFYQEGDLIAVNSRHEQKVRIFDYDGKFIKSFSTGFQSNDLFGFENQLITVNEVGFRRIPIFTI